MNFSNETVQLRSILTRYKDESIIFLSSVHNARYSVQSVDDSGVVVQRLDAEEPQRLTFSHFEQLCEKIRKSGGRFPFVQLDSTAAVRVAALQAPFLALSADRKTVVDVSGADRGVGIFCQWLEKLRVASDEGQPRLYKPMMIDAVVKGIETGELQHNKIRFEWVVPHFVKGLSDLGISVGEPEAAHAFCHLTNELFWMHALYDVRNPMRDGSEGPRAAREKVKYALLKDTFWNVLQDRESRVRVLETLRKKWLDLDSSGKHLSGQTISAPSSQDKKGQFSEIFQEFLASYVSTDRGKKHILSYAQARKEGQENFQRILEAKRQGEDITDLVLAKLLPYANTANNRKKGVWIHVAQSVTKDIKEWFEGAGWTQPEDWPKVAEAILNFVQRCVDDPGQLTEACSQFASLPFSKGFQTGMLTPMLSALKPDDYLVINNKSRKVINYFTESTFDLKLTEYPAVNSNGKELIGEFHDLLSQPTVAVARPDDVFDMFCHWMVGIKKFPPETIKYWKIAPGEQAWDWERCRDERSIGIGWNELGDISSLTRQEFMDRRDELLKKFPDWTKAAVDQVWRFAKIAKGDRIVANRGISEVVGIGTVVGGYYFQPDATYAHRLAVEWDDVEPRRINKEGWRRTLIELSPEEFGEIQNARILETGTQKPSGQTTPPNPVYPLERIADETGFELPILERWIRALNRKGQAIVYGPPGTGKTYLAERLARHLIGGSDGFVEIVQFHPAYAYEDFIQGIRPQVRANGILDYQMVPGRFLDFCGRAARSKGICALIIDEINRAKVPHVFGELMYLLEYRNQKVPLAGGGQLSLPSNVRIIGTMNTADRSIALVDHALRRRFASFHVPPNYGALRKFHAGNGFNVDGLVQLLTKLNGQIGDPHYEIGISFFMRKDLADQVEDIWTMEIEPYLEEYFFDQPDKVTEFRWAKIGNSISS